MMDIKPEQERNRGILNLWDGEVALTAAHFSPSVSGRMNNHGESKVVFTRLTPSLAVLAMLPASFPKPGACSCGSWELPGGCKI